MSSLQLVSLSVAYFGAIKSADIQFRNGINVLYGPNDLGKSTLAASIRCALLTSAKSKQASRWQSWSSSASPTVRLTFKIGKTQYRVAKTFNTKRGTATLEEFQDEVPVEVAKQASVDPALRELLSWGLPMSNRRAPISFTSVSLLGEQARASQVFEVGFDTQDEEATKDALTKALGSLSSSSDIDQVIAVARTQVDLHFDSAGRHRAGQHAPIRPFRDAVTAAESALAAAEEAFDAQRSLKEKLAQLTKSITDAQHAQKKLKKERSTLSVQNDERLSLLNQLSQLEQAHKALTQQQKQLAKIQQEHASEKKKLTKLTDERTQAEAVLADITSRSEERRIAQQQQALDDEKRKQLNAEHKLLQQQSEQLTQQHRRHSKASEKLGQVQLELSSERKQLEIHHASAELKQQQKQQATLHLLHAQYWGTSDLLQRAKKDGRRLETLSRQHAAKTATLKLSPPPTTLETIQAIRLQERRDVLLTLRERMPTLSSDNERVLEEWIQRTLAEWNAPPNTAIQSVLPNPPESGWLALLEGGSIADLEKQMEEAADGFASHDSMTQRLESIAQQIQDQQGHVPERAPEHSEDVYQTQLDEVLKELSTVSAEFEKSASQVTILEAQTRLAEEQTKQAEADLRKTLAAIGAKSQSVELSMSNQKARVEAIRLQIEALSNAHKDTSESKEPSIEQAKEAVRFIENSVSSAKMRHDELTGRLGAAKEGFSPEELSETHAALESIKQKLLPLATCEEQISITDKKLSLLSESLIAQQQELDRSAGALATLQSRGAASEARVTQLRKRHQRSLLAEANAMQEARGWKRLLEAAEEVAQESTTGLAELMGDELTERFSELIRFVARDELNYGPVVFGQALDTPSVHIAGSSRTLSSFSVGVREQLATILRLIVAEKLQNTLILDDQLTQTDSRRLLWFSKLLEQVSEKAQIIVLTCREHEYQLGRDTHMVNLAASISRVVTRAES